MTELTKLDKFRSNDVYDDIQLKTNANEDFGFKHIPPDQFERIIKCVQKNRLNQQRISIWRDHLNLTDAQLQDINQLIGQPDKTTANNDKKVIKTKSSTVKFFNNSKLTDSGYNNNNVTNTIQPSILNNSNIRIMSDAEIQKVIENAVKEVFEDKVFGKYENRILRHSKFDNKNYHDDIIYEDSKEQFSSRSAQLNKSCKEKNELKNKQKTKEETITKKLNFVNKIEQKQNNYEDFQIENYELDSAQSEIALNYINYCTENESDNEIDKSKQNTPKNSNKSKKIQEDEIKRKEVQKLNEEQGNSLTGRKSNRDIVSEKSRESLKNIHNTELENNFVDSSVSDSYSDSVVIDFDRVSEFNYSKVQTNNKNDLNIQTIEEYFKLTPEQEIEKYFECLESAKVTPKESSQKLDFADWIGKMEKDKKMRQEDDEMKENKKKEDFDNFIGDCRKTMNIKDLEEINVKEKETIAAQKYYSDKIGWKNALDNKGDGDKCINNTQNTIKMKVGDGTTEVLHKNHNYKMSTDDDLGFLDFEMDDREKKLCSFEMGLPNLNDTNDTNCPTVNENYSPKNFKSFATIEENSENMHSFPYDSNYDSDIEPDGLDKRLIGNSLQVDKNKLKRNKSILSGHKKIESKKNKNQDLKNKKINGKLPSELIEENYENTEAPTTPKQILAVIFSKVTQFHQKIIEEIKRIKNALNNNVIAAESDAEKKRRENNANEFATRFARNYLYQIYRMTEEVRLLNIADKKEDIVLDSYIKVCGLFGLLHQALNTYCKQIKYFICNQQPKKLDLLIDCISNATNVCVAQNIFSKNDEIIKKIMGTCDDMRLYILQLKNSSNSKNKKDSSKKQKISLLKKEVALNDNKLSMYENKSAKKTPVDKKGAEQVLDNSSRAKDSKANEKTKSEKLEISNDIKVQPQSSPKIVIEKVNENLNEKASPSKQQDIKEDIKTNTANENENATKEPKGEVSQKNGKKKSKKNNKTKLIKVPYEHEEVIECKAKLDNIRKVCQNTEITSDIKKISPNLPRDQMVTQLMNTLHMITKKEVEDILTPLVRQLGLLINDASSQNVEEVFNKLNSQINDLDLNNDELSLPKKKSKGKSKLEKEKNGNPIPHVQLEDLKLTEENLEIQRNRKAFISSLPTQFKNNNNNDNNYNNIKENQQQQQQQQYQEELSSKNNQNTNVQQPAVENLINRENNDVISIPKRKNSNIKVKQVQNNIENCHDSNENSIENNKSHNSDSKIQNKKKKKNNHKNTSDNSGISGGGGGSSSVNCNIVVDNQNQGQSAVMQLINHDNQDGRGDAANIANKNINKNNDEPKIFLNEVQHLLYDSNIQYTIIKSKNDEPITQYEMLNIDTSESELNINLISDSDTSFNKQLEPIEEIDSTTRCSPQKPIKQSPLPTKQSPLPKQIESKKNSKTQLIPTISTKPIHNENVKYKNYPFKNVDGILNNRMEFIKNIAENPLYVNENFGEPWKIVTGISELLLEELTVSTEKAINFNEKSFIRDFLQNEIEI